MKPDIHPDNYRTVLFYDSGADQGWLIRSCANTHGKTMVWKDGIEYPLFSLDTSSGVPPRVHRQTTQCQYRRSRQQVQPTLPIYDVFLQKG